jgi:beta-glucosidase
MEARIDALVSQLSLEEKVSLVAGCDLWHTPGVARLGVPGLKVTDGPSGARGGMFTGGLTSASFPCGIATGATWNVELVRALGEALADETRSKGAEVLLGPTVNLHRHPLGGRHFESYSEDPVLSAEIAVAWIRGLQSGGVACCVKHYVANDSEFERMTISSDVAERALRELYLLPFEHAVKRGSAWSLMSAYNKVNGTYASEHVELLRGVLKGEWGFDGAVISDWFGTHDGAACARGGLDVEMPGPPRHYGSELLGALKSGAVAEADLDEMVRRVLRLGQRTGAFERARAEAERPAERSDDRPEHRTLARRLATEAIVLLRNEGGALPLAGGRPLRRLALIGPNARYTALQGGGSARVSPHYEVSALAGLRERAERAGIELTYAAGCTSHKRLPLPDAAWLAPAGGSGPGLSLELWNGLEPAGAPVAARTPRRLEFTWLGEVADGVDRASFCARLSGRFTPPEAGRWAFSLACAGRARLYVDDALVVDAWDRYERGDSFFGLGSAEAIGHAELAAGRPVALRVEYARREAPFVAGLRVGCLPPVSDDAFASAVALAEASDAAVVVVGSDAEWESEGHDRKDLSLPGRQAELVRAVAAANPRTVVVLNTGAPVDVEGFDAAAALLQLWFAGQEAGRALADVLFGDADPGGRLPTTWPRRLQDTPAFASYPGERGHVAYGENVFAGYRHYDLRGVEPLFPFGHGLSYARFAFGEPSVELEEEAGPGGRVRVRATLEVTNVGERPGQAVVQLYVADPVSTLARAPQELRAFAKLSLAPGERRTAQLVLGTAALAAWDPARSAFVAEPGAYELRFGRSSRDVFARAAIELAHEHVEGPAREL